MITGTSIRKQTPGCGPVHHRAILIVLLLFLTAATALFADAPWAESPFSDGAGLPRSETDSCTWNLMNAAGGDSVPTVAFETVAKGSQAAVTKPRTAVIRSHADWNALWNEVNANRIPVPEAPKIDFSAHLVAAVFAGRKPSGGYAVTVQRVTRNTEGLHIWYRLSQPAPGAIVTMALTSPYHIISVATADRSLPVTFHAIP